MFKRANKNPKKQSPELNINEAIRIEERLSKISEGDRIVVSKEDEEFFKKAALLINTFLSIYTTWTKSKKKISKLLKMVFGNRTEKLNKIKKEGDILSDSKEDISTSSDDQSNKEETKDKIQNSNKIDNNDKKDGKKKRKGGNGKNPADAYEGAAEITCSLCDHLLPGNMCPSCGKNKLYEVDPKKIVRLVGNAPITAFVFILQQVRCICGASFTADVGDEFRDIYNEDKYGPSALAAMMIYKYLVGVPFGTIAKLQEMNGVPLPASTQVNKIKNNGLPVIQAVISVLKNLASNANLLGFDDTVIRTISKRKTKDGNGETNRGHGTVVVADYFDRQENQIILFDFDTSKHAGDVVCDLLKSRNRESLPLLISDGLNSYDECKKQGINVNCNIHARRKMVEEDPRVETYVGITVLNAYGEIYKNEKYCNDQNLTSKERLEYHQNNSKLHFETIYALFNIVTGAKDTPAIRKKYSFPEYLTEDEPNGDLRKVAEYFLKRYDALTVVLKIKNTPLDTNYVERMIKVIIKIRKNALFFNNISSASYSGEILSLLETAVVNDVNVFDYVAFLLANKNKVIATPQNYLPWNYKNSSEENKVYWDEVDKLRIFPSNFLEPLLDESCRSLA